MKPLPAAALGLVLGALITGTAFTSTPVRDGSTRVPAVGDPANDTAATIAFQAAAGRLSDALQMRYTGEPDLDYITLMLAIQAASVDLSRAVIDHGHDNAVRGIALEVINQQTAETDRMLGWRDNTQP